MPRCETLLFNDPDSIVLCGDQPDMVERALKLGVNCIILCQTEAKKQWIQNAHRTCIISTPFDAARVAKLIYQAIPISRPCHTEDTICFHLGDYIDDNLRHVSGARRNALSGDGGAHGSDDTIRRAFSAEPKDNMLFLPGVMSRKKQIIPMLTALWG